MTTPSTRRMALICCLFPWTTAGCTAATPAASALPDKEKANIEALIKKVESLQDAVFIRNDTQYEAKAAAKFLRGKWENQAKEIKTAKDFIEKCASVSSTTGKPYQIKFKDGKTVPSKDFFLEELKKLEKP